MSNVAQRIGQEFNTVRTEIAEKANTNSPALSGIPTSTNPASSDNSNRIATTSFVKTSINDTLGLINNGGNITISANAGTADKLSTPRLITLTGDAGGSAYFDGSQNATINVTVANNSHNHTISNITGLEDELALKVDMSDIGVSVPSLDGGKIPDNFIPDSVRDIVIVDDVNTFLPATGDSRKLYIVKPTKVQYIWNGTSYYPLSINGVTSINGGSGAICVNAYTVGLSNVKNVDNTNASNICSGVLSSSFGGTGTTTQTGTGSIVKQYSPVLKTPNIGVATGVSFNSITGLSNVTPLAATEFGTIGTSTLAARADHTHPVTVSDISGNSGTTSSLLTPRNFRIGTANRVFNGTQDVIWTLDDIGMAEKIHDHTIDDVTGLTNCLSCMQHKSPLLNCLSNLGFGSPGVLKSDGYGTMYYDNIEYLTSCTMKDYLKSCTSAINLSFDSNNRILKLCGSLANPVSHGIMSSLDKIKLDGLSNYVHPETLGYCHIPAGTESDNGKFLTRLSGGHPSWVSVPSALVTSVNGKQGSVVICESDISGLTARVDSKIDKNQSIVASTGTKITYDANGLVTSSSSLVVSDIPNLDANKITSGTIDINRLPSDVNDVLEYDDYLSFPITGLSNKIYVDKSNSTQYRWNGTSYTGFGSSGSVTSINGKFGAVLITKDEIIGIENINNTSDINKPISSATQVALNSKVDISSLHSVATTGNYNCLSNKPVIPIVPTTVSSFTNDSGYLKSVDFKTINGIQISGSGDICVSSNNSWASITGKPTTLLGYNISDAYTKAEIDSSMLSKQESLVSGTNIKTVNGNTLLGSGNLNLLTCVSWNDILSKPNSVSGYGITDVYTKAATYSNVEIDNKILTINSSINSKASQLYVDNKFTEIIGLAPETLDTLGEIADKLLANESSDAALVSIVANKVDKVNGKQLSTNDYTNTEKAKLESLNNYTLPVSTGTVLGGIKPGNGFSVDANGVLTYSNTYTWAGLLNKPTTVAGYGITDVYTKNEINLLTFEPKNVNIQEHISAIGNPHGLTKADILLGNVANIAPMDLPINTLTVNALATKQDALVSGTSIKTVGGTSLLGSGNITIEPEFSSILNKPTTLSGYGITDAQDLFVSGVDIKTINGSSILGGGNINLASTWTSVSEKPTTISGFGITDAYIKSEIDTKFSDALIDTTNELILKANTQDVYDKAYIDELFNIIEW